MKGSGYLPGEWTAKQGDEIDGWEFEVDNLDDLVDVLKTYKSIHLNFYGDENIDMWLTQNY